MRTLFYVGFVVAILASCGQEHEVGESPTDGGLKSSGCEMASPVALGTKNPLEIDSILLSNAKFDGLMKSSEIKVVLFPVRIGKDETKTHWLGARAYTEEGDFSVGLANVYTGSLSLGGGGSVRGEIAEYRTKEGDTEVLVRMKGSDLVGLQIKSKGQTYCLKSASRP